MNRRKGRVWYGILAAVLVFSLLPAPAAAAEGAPAAIAAVEATAAAPAGSGYGDITIRTANAFYFTEGKANPSIPVEVEGLPAGSWRARMSMDGKAEDNYGMTTEGSGVVTARYVTDDGDLTVGAHQFSVTVFSRDETVTFETVTLPVWLAAPADLAIPAEELNRENVVSVYDSDLYLNLYVPGGTLDKSQRYSLRLLQNGETVGGTLPDRDATVWDTTMVDYRYDDVLREDAGIWYDVQNISGTVYLQTPLTAEGGPCTVEIRQGEQVVYTVSNAVDPTELPVVDSMDIPFADNAPGQESLRCVLDITGGHPDQFQVKAYQGTELLGASQGYRVTYVNYSEVRAEYVIPLSTPLEEGSRYTVVAERSDGGSFVGEGQEETYISSSLRITDGIFPSHYYANVVLDTVGTDPGETYKLTLQDTNQQELAWTTASPDANGRFEAEFLDGDGKPLRLAPNTQYQLGICRKNQASGQWGSPATQWIYNNGILESALQPQSAGTPLELDLISGSVIDSDDGVIQVNLYVNTGSTLPDNLNLFQLRLNGVAGGAQTLSLQSSERQEYTSGIYLKLYYAAPAGTSWYWPELLYDGGEVINSSTGENALARTYPLRSDEMVRAYVTNNQTDSGLYFAVGATGRNLGGQSVELRLYQYGNRSLTPDAVLTLTEAEGYKITQTQMAQLDPNARYVAEFWAGGAPVGAESNYNYFNIQDNVLNWNQDSYTAAAADTANGTLELLTIPENEDGSIPALNEVYVRAVADSGYQLKAGSIRVNGQPILGRSFVLTENSTVTAEFEPIPAETYPVEVVENLYNGTLEPDVTRAAEGQTVTVTAVPEPGWEAYAVMCYAGAPYSSETISLTQTGTNTYTFVMPAEPVYLSATFTQAQLNSYPIRTSSQVVNGSLIHPDSAYAGELVEFTAVADPGYTLETGSVTASYVGSDGLRYLELIPLGEDRWQFTMPEGEVSLSARFELSGAIPQQPGLLINDTVARSAGDWSLPLRIPEELWDRLYQLNWESLYLQGQILDQEGTLIARQECRYSYDVLKLTNCGLAAGDYTLNVIAGDASHAVVLGGDTLHVVDGADYTANVTPQELTVDTKARDVTFNLSCAVTDLKGTYTATLRDEAGTVYASSSQYQILYYGDNRNTTGGSGTAGGDGSTVGANTNIRFRLSVTKPLVSGRAYHLELESGGMTLVPQGQINALYVTDSVVILEGVYDKDARLWTAQTENLAPGTYSAVYQDGSGTGRTYVAVVDADGVLTINDPLDGLENLSRYFTLKDGQGQDLTGFSISCWTETGDKNSNWYTVTLAGARHALYNPYISNYDLVYPMTASRTIQAALDGAAGAGSWKLYLETAAGDQMAASGAVDDLSAFSLTVPKDTDQSEQRYSLEVLDGSGGTIARQDFAFTTFELLTTDARYWGEAGAGVESLTVRPMNADPEDTLAVFVGYRDSLGVHALPVTKNSDGSWTVDLTGLPYGTYKPALGLYGQEDDSLNINWSFQRASAVKEQLPKVTVAWPQLSSDGSGNTLAAVTYDGGVPAGDVTMHIYTLEDDAATFLRTVNIGRSAYTINSGALGLHGTYLFCFTLADGTSIGQWSASMGMLSVTFLGWNGSILDTQQVAYGQSVVPPTAPERDGYVFTGWSGSCINVTENRVLTARYAPETLTVTFFPAGGTGGPEAQEVSYGKLAEKPTETPTRTGYTFTGWYIAPSGGQEFNFSTPLYADTVLYAGWEKETHTIMAEGTTIMELLVNGQPVSGTWSACPGDLVEVRLPYDTWLRGLSCNGDSLPLYSDGTYWTAVFTMPDKAVTLTAQYAETGILEIHTYGPEVTEFTLYSAAGMYLGSENKSEVPVGTYTLEGYLSDSKTFREENVVITRGQTTTVTLPSQPAYPVTFRVTGSPNDNLPSGLTLSVYGMGRNKDRMYYVDAVTVQDGTASIDLPDDNYVLTASTGTITEGMTFTVSGQALPHDVALKLGLNVQGELNCTGTTGVSGTAYVTVESELGNGAWAAVYTAAVNASGTFLLENVIMDTTWTYRLRVSDFYDQRGVQQKFSSEPVEFTPGGTEAVRLTYQLQENNIPNFSGEGNGVLLSRSTAYPGDTVELIVRYNGTAAPEAFTVQLPEGLTTLDNGSSLSLTPDGGTQGTVRAMLKVAGTARRGSYTIPVKVTAGGAGGASYDFSAAVLTVGQPTLNGPAMARAGEPINVYGEAPEGSKVTIRGTSGQVYAVAVAQGRFYSASVTLSDTDTLIGEAVVGGVPVQTNELYVMVTAEQPLALTGVTYDGRTAASWNRQLDSYLFNQYVDMELKGFDLRFYAVFNQAVESVTFRFCGREFTAYSSDRKTWTATFGRGAWGGAGLKEITAQVTVADKEYQLPVAIVNLLIDPSGVITDENGQPLAGVTVLCQVWDEDAETWKDLDASAVGQPNPQVTDSEGRYGWYVPEGKYRVLAFREGYQDYDSSEHAVDLGWDGTIPPARTDINFSMTPVRGTYTVYPTAVTGGTVAANAASAQAGQSVTLTVTPEAGLRVSSVTVRTLSGTSVPVARGEAENTYTFTMPYADVTYSAAFSGGQQTELDITSAGTDGQVSVTITGLLENARLMAAYYDKDDRMLGVTTRTVTAGTETAQLTVPYSGTASEVRVFLLDQNQKPLVPRADFELK